MYLDAIDTTPPAAIVAAPTAASAAAAELSVLTYNIRGLPWPVAKGRATALKAIGKELAEMRAQGRQPDVVLIQEGFRGEVADLVKASGYRYWARGPGRGTRPAKQAPDGGHSFGPARYLGEGLGKLTGGGLHVLSDLPITEVRKASFRYCAGLDCLANKGAMLARISPPGVPGEIDVINTHLNSKGASRAPRSRSLQAHNLQVEELLAFISRNRAANAPLLVGGDFNVKGAPERYNHSAAARPYRVVSEFCNVADAACEGQTPADAVEPWLRSQDLQAFVSNGPVDVRPVRVETVFAATASRRRLSDHDGYLVRYRLSWDPEAIVRRSQPIATAAAEIAGR